MAVEVVVGDAVYGVGHTVLGCGVGFAVYSYPDCMAVPRPTAAVGLFHFGGVFCGQRLGVGVVRAAATLYLPADSRLNVGYSRNRAARVDTLYVARPPVRQDYTRLRRGRTARAARRGG